MREEDLENVDHVEHRRPGLIYDIETDGAGSRSTLSIFHDGVTKNVQLIDVGMEDSVDKADARRLVWILIGELHMNLP